uniref:C2H2-type domain-containing protein n=1 Tax=Acrobeloides nanus TaxID=290746 RepID=A0A914D7C7_9BILA
MDDEESNKAVSSRENSPARNGAGQPEVIDLDDDDDVIIEEPPAKRQRPETSPIPEDPKNTTLEKPPASVTPVSTKSDSEKPSSKKEPELTSYSTLLDRLEVYIKNSIESNENVERKVLDALLAAINIQVQKEPFSVRKLILDKQLVLPNTISFPPSQVVELLIEHDPDHQLSRVINKMFGDERPKLTENEKRERQQLKIAHPAPHMTKFLMDIGQDLVQETTYCDIVHARNLPEIPKNMETYKQVAAQLKPVWESLKTKNEPFKLKHFTCQVCHFRTESRTTLSIHRQTLHYDGKKYQCAMCPEFDTNESRIIRHYLSEHDIMPLPKEEPLSKVQCPICEAEFNFKGQRENHMKTCKKDISKIRNLMGFKVDDVTMINRWLWPKPPHEPSILAQQQEAQKQQQLRQQQQLQQQKLAAAAAAAQSLSANRVAGNTVLAQQQLLAAKQLAAKTTPVAHSKNMPNLLQDPTLAQALRNKQLTPQLLQQAMQLQLRQQQLQQQQKRLSGAAGSASSSPATSKPLTPQVPIRKPAPNVTPTARATASAVVSSSTSSSTPSQAVICEICDAAIADKEKYLAHLQMIHRQMRGKTLNDMHQGAPLACSRCRERFWTYEGLERHLVMGHGLVTSDLLAKAQKKEDGGRCKLCGKQYAFNMLQHLVTDHQVKLCSAEIMYSCDVCSFKCSSYQKLETHLSTVHPKK